MHKDDGRPTDVSAQWPLAPITAASVLWGNIEPTARTWMQHIGRADYPHAVQLTFSTGARATWPLGFLTTTVTAGAR